MTQSRPFAVSAVRSAPASGRSLRVLIRPAAGVELTHARLQPLRSRFAALATMGAWGAMAGDTVPPLQSNVVLHEDGAPSGPFDYVWEFDLRGVHPGVLCVVVNLLHRFHEEIAPLQHVTLQSPVVGAGGSIPQEPPFDFEPRPFALEQEYENAQILVDVEFTSRADPDAAEPFRTAWDAWVDTAFAGGFSSADAPVSMTSLFVEDDLRVSSTGMSGAFDQAMIDDSGWSCLVNMLQTFHHRLVPILHVTIE